MDDNPLHRALAEFLWAFEEVFDRDWVYSQAMMNDFNINAMIGEDRATFLNPTVGDIEDDWGNRALLLDRYERLKQIMDELGIQPS